MITPLAGGVIALFGIQVFHILASIGLLKQYNALQDLVSENGIGRNRLAVGTPAPNVAMTDLRSGKSYEYEYSATTSARVLLFLSPKCTFCVNIVRELAHVPTEKLSRLALICLGLDRDCNQMLKRLANGVSTFADSSHRIARQFGISNAPEAVLITRSGKIRGYSYPRTVPDLLKLLEDPTLDYELDDNSAFEEREEEWGAIGESTPVVIAGDNGRP